MWKLTTKFQKKASEIDYTSTSLINNNDLNIDDLFLISNEVKVNLWDYLLFKLLMLKQIH